ncbi:hypothetical protein KAR91_20075 [Candidatus Pacearchaeota archaeon]|nr:hypothetical protein [Candidatus Pacearchaeota archaeon]
MKILLTGPLGWASFIMRTRVLIPYLEDLGHTIHIQDCGDAEITGGPYDVGYLIKFRSRPRSWPNNLRDICDKLVWDHLDCWASPARQRIYDCFRETNKILKADVIIATSPAGLDVLVKNFFDIQPPRIIILKHQSDERISPDWYDPEGPIVYGGTIRFLGEHVESLRNACEILGRELRINSSQHHGWKVLEGASLQLGLKFPPHNTEWNQHCRPTVKIANSVASSVPIIVNGWPSETSLLNDTPTLTPADMKLGILHIAEKLRIGLDSESPDWTYSQQDFCADWVKHLLEQGEEKDDETGEI